MNTTTTLVVIAAALTVSTARAQESVTIGSSSSRTMNLLEEKLLPDFEAATGLTVNNVAGSSANHLARLQAQLGNQELDVVMLDDAVMEQAVSLGFCAPLPEDFTAKFIPEAVIGGRGVGFGLYATGLAYNSQTFADRGWAGPTSWNDLARPELANNIAVATIGNGYGLSTLVMLARANGGDENNIEPGFTAMTEVSPNVVTFLDSTSRIQELMQTNEIALTVWNNSGVKLMADTGFPIDFVIPQEGGIVGMSALCIVEGASNPEGALQLIEMMTGADAQQLYANTTAGAPTLADFEVQNPHPLMVDEATRSNLFRLDGGVVQAERASWTQRWTREVER